MPAPSPVPSRTTGTSCVPSKPDPELRALTQVGGGGYFELTTADSLSPTFARVAEELHRQYLLGFTAATLDNAVHRLEVRVRRAGVSVRARSEYLAAER